MDGITLLDNIGNIVESPCASIKVDCPFNVSFLVILTWFHPPFTEHPAIMSVRKTCHFDGTDQDGVFLQVLCPRCVEGLGDRITCLLVDILFEGQQLVMELMCFTVTSIHQGIDGSRSKAEHTIARDIWDNIDIA